MEILNYTGSEQPLNLGEHRLSISTGLGNEFSELLEKDHVELTTQDQQELRRIINEINSSKSNRLVVHSYSQNVTASLLRIYDPNIIIGSNGCNAKDTLNQIGHQLGLSEPLSTASMISNRLLGREKVAVVVLNSNEESKVEKDFKRIPESGILVLSR
jgi:ribosomal protein S24E